MVRLRKNILIHQWWEHKRVQACVETYQKYRCIYLLSQQSCFREFIQTGTKRKDPEYRCFRLYTFKRKEDHRHRIPYCNIKKQETKNIHSYTLIIKCTQFIKTDGIICHTLKEKLHPIFKTINLQATFCGCCYSIL